jgi:hypothetical protein
MFVVPGWSKKPTGSTPGVGFLKNGRKEGKG